MEESTRSPQPTRKKCPRHAPFSILELGDGARPPEANRAQALPRPELLEQFSADERCEAEEVTSVISLTRHLLQKGVQSSPLCRMSKFHESPELLQVFSPPHDHVERLRNAKGAL